MAGISKAQLKAHFEWVANHENGKRLVMWGAYLQGAYLQGAHGVGALVPIGSRGGMLYWTGSFDGIPLRVFAGCWAGSLAEFAKRVKATHGGSLYAREYMSAIQFIKAWEKIQREAEQ